MAPAAMPAFAVENISYRYNEAPVLQDLSLQVKQGERIALLGANGSGKSTLLRLLSGLSFAHKGRISFFGQELTPSRLADEDFFFAFRRRVGVVFQNPDVQLFNASVYDELAFGPLQMKWPKDKIRARVEETLETMGIADLRGRAPHRLSGGEKKRVALASVLVLDPEVLLLDEPTAALDPGSQNQMVELLSSWTDGSRTVITATHDLAALETIADRCYLLEGGQVAGEGEPLAILHDVPLLERTRLIRLHGHRHPSDASQPHPHLHRHDVR
jgi:cobalt/nickel transport system ATP-binding protein